MAEKLFIFPVRVYIEDTDAGGIVYYANYLKFMERARTEFMRDLGFEQKLSMNSVEQFVVSTANMTFLNSATMDMKLEISVELVKLAKSYFVVCQKVLSEKVIFCEAEVKIARVNSQKRKPIAMPEFVYAALQERL